MNSIKFGILGTAAVLAAAVLLLAACESTPQPSTTVTDFQALVQNPGQYNGQVITVEGYYFDGFEIEALGTSLTPRSGAMGMMPSPPVIWLAGALPDSVHDRLTTQTQTPSGYPEHYGLVRLTGTFAYGSQYGHLNAYDYQITISGAEYLG